MAHSVCIKCECKLKERSIRQIDMNKTVLHIHKNIKKYSKSTKRFCNIDLDLWTRTQAPIMGKNVMPIKPKEYISRNKEAKKNIVQPSPSFLRIHDIKTKQ